MSRARSTLPTVKFDRFPTVWHLIGGIRTSWVRGLVLLACLAAALLACDSVHSDHLIGEPLDAALTEEYEGVWGWGGGEGPEFFVKHVGDNRLVVATVNWDDESGEFQVEPGSMVVTTHHDMHLLWIVPARGNEVIGDRRAGPTLTADASQAGLREGPWGLLALSVFEEARLIDPPLVIYLLDYDAFRRLVDEGSLEGEVVSDNYSFDVHLRSDKSTLDEFLDPDRLRGLIQREEPGVLLRYR